MVSPAAPVEQAEPQGSAAPGQDTSAAATGDNGAATPESFGSLFKQRVFEQAARREGRAAASSAGRETSADVEQPASSSRERSRPGASTDDEDGSAPADPSAADRPNLSRSQRKALKTGQAGETPTDTESTAVTTASDPAPAPTEPETVAARVERVEKTVVEGLSRLEGLLKAPTPAEADPSLDGESKAYADLFGDDTEFARRADIALHGSTKGHYLDTSEADELAVWASNRKAKDFSAGQVNRQYQSSFSTMVLKAAEEFGIPPGDIQKPGTTFRDIFGAFISRGEARKDAELTAANAKTAKLEAANRLLADENEALQNQLPASARSVLAGGATGSSRGAALADRSRMSGQQLMRAGLSKASQGRSGRPGAR